MPTLPHLTALLTEHCNLNCRTCGHFSSVAAPFFADVDTFRKDLARLAELFRNIGSFWLMGGEPLLHPAPELFIEATRAAFPSSHIWFTTNGTLLGKARPRFWEACKVAGVTIEISAYPPVRNDVSQLRFLCESKGVKVVVKEITQFTAWMNLRGDSDALTSFTNCKRLENSVPLLRKSRLYVCSVSGTISHLNRRFGAQVPEVPGMDLYDSALSGEAVLKFLAQPTPACCFCGERYIHRDWGQGSAKLEDWDAG